MHHNVTTKSGDALLTGCYVPFVPSMAMRSKNMKYQIAIYHSCWKCYWGCGNEWDSPSEVAGRRKEEHIRFYNHNNHNHTVIRCGDAWLTGCYVPCVPRPSSNQRGENLNRALIIVRMILHQPLGMWKEWDSPATEVERRKQQHVIYSANNHEHISMC